MSHPGCASNFNNNRSVFRNCNFNGELTNVQQPVDNRWSNGKQTAQTRKFLPTFGIKLESCWPSVLSELSVNVGC